MKNLQFLWQQFKFKNALTTATLVGAIAGSSLLVKGALKPTSYDKLSDFLIAIAAIEVSRRAAFASMELMDTDADLSYAERRVLIANHTDNLRDESTEAEEEATSDQDDFKIIEDVCKYWQQQQKHLMIVGGTGDGKTYFMQRLIKQLPKWFIKVYDVDATKDDWKTANLVANTYPEIESEMLTDLGDIDAVAANRAKIGSEKWKPKQFRLLVCDEFPVTLSEIRKTAKAWSGTHAKRTRKLGRFIALLVQNDTIANTGLEGDNGVRDSCYVRVYLGKYATKRAEQLSDKRILEWLNKHDKYDVCIVDDLPAWRIK